MCACTQLPLPGYWPRNASWTDPRDELAQLRRDKLEAKYEIRQVLDKYTGRHAVEASEVSRLVLGYVDDLLGDFFFEREDELRGGITSELERDEPLAAVRTQSP